MEIIAWITVDTGVSAVIYGNEAEFLEAEIVEVVIEDPEVRVGRSVYP
jgi:hypothetical protein